MELNKEKIQNVMEQVKKVIKGKDNEIEVIMTSILAQGHILIEDIPGVGKTTMAMAFSKAMDLDESRMQFTPDVLPTDVVGFSILRNDGQFEYKKGAVLCNLFLADEINRTSSKTQSALLEVMEEGQVTVDGITREVPQPFIVMATQNPMGSIGTHALPESQLDRFMIKITIGYPSEQNEVEMLKDRNQNVPMESVEKVITKQDLEQMQKGVEEITIHDAVMEYIVKLVTETRHHPMIELGVSPRGSIALTNMAKAKALICGREYVLPEDVRSVLPFVFTHRIILNSKARVSKQNVNEIMNEIMNHTKAPSI